MLLAEGEQKSLQMDQHGYSRKGKAWWDTLGHKRIIVRLIQRLVGRPCAPKTNCKAKSIFWMSFNAVPCGCRCSLFFLACSASDCHGGTQHGPDHLLSRQHFTAGLSLQHDGRVPHLPHHRTFYLLVLLPQEKGGSA